jgi:hypothetical protein
MNSIGVARAAGLARYSRRPTHHLDQRLPVPLGGECHKPPEPSFTNVRSIKLRFLARSVASAKSQSWSNPSHSPAMLSRFQKTTGATS